MWHIIETNMYSIAALLC